MNDPLHELAEANVQLGNRPSAAQVPVRRAMSQSDYAAQQLAQAAAVRPIVIVRNQPQPRRSGPFAWGFGVTMGILAAIFVFTFITAFMAGCFDAMLHPRQEIRYETQPRSVMPWENSPRKK